MYNYIFEMTYTHFIIVNSCSVLRNIYVSGNHILILLMNQLYLKK